jgi:dCMP deaminase
MSQSVRPSWDSIWMTFAKSIARRSIDDRFKVGAVIVSIDNTQVLSVGYNGDQANGGNTIESDEPGKSGCIHAEINALIKLDYNNHKQKKMYVTLSPCRMCAKAIVNAGINEVIYLNQYRDTSGLDILTGAGIKLVHDIDDCLNVDDSDI